MGQLIHDFVERPDDVEAVPSVDQALAAALVAGEVKRSVWLECLFYSAEEDLMAITRAAARLDGGARQQLLEHI